MSVLQGINGILADEMGLGKTVQSIAFLSYLAQVSFMWLYCGSVHLVAQMVKSLTCQYCNCMCSVSQWFIICGCNKGWAVFVLEQHWNTSI